MFYIETKNISERTALLSYFKANNILAVFHYLSLHKSSFYEQNYPHYANKHLPNSDRYSDTLIRLPLYYDLSNEEVNFIIEKINVFYNSQI